MKEAAITIAMGGSFGVIHGAATLQPAAHQLLQTTMPTLQLRQMTKRKKTIMVHLVVHLAVVAQIQIQHTVMVVEVGSELYLGQKQQTAWQTTATTAQPTLILQRTLILQQTQLQDLAPTQPVLSQVETILEVQIIQQQVIAQKEEGLASLVGGTLEEGKFSLKFQVAIVFLTDLEHFSPNSKTSDKIRLCAKFDSK